MILYRNNRDICFRIQVSCENQNKMAKHIDSSFAPLFELKQKQHYSVKFEYKKFTCACQKKKQEFSYANILKAETTADGVIIYLDNNTYISVATEQHEKHNTALYDIVTLLKRRCRFRFSMRTPISYPENELDERFSTDKNAIAQIPFSLTDADLKRMLWYDCLFEEKGIVFFIYGG